MAKLHAANAKVYLRTVTIPRLLAGAGEFPYFSIGAVRADLRRGRVMVAPATLGRYLHELMRGGVLFDAGRGWYSTLPEPFVLDRAPVRTLVEKLEKRFPYLDYSCWSTAQIAAYSHLQLARFVSVIYTERDAMESVANGLREEGFAVYLHPSQREVAKGFRIEGETVVIRPTVTQAPVDGKYAAIEKIIVDLYFEVKALGLMDIQEHHRVTANIVRDRRISMGALARYAEARRKLGLEELFGRPIN